MIESIPQEIDVSQDWQVTYWTGAFQVSRNRLLQAVAKVGRSAARIRSYLNDGITVGIRGPDGVARRVTKIMPMTDGISVSVPYHSARQGWLYKHTVEYERTFGVARFADAGHFTAEDCVKLSMHIDGGFVQFSTGGRQPIISGRDAEGRPRGLALDADHPVNVTTGPLFGVQMNDLSEFEELGHRPAELFEDSDLYNHPRMTHADSTAYHLEGFMFDRDKIPFMHLDGDRLMYVADLPFISMLKFPFHVRMVEFPSVSIVLGLLIHKMDAFGAGYRLNGPAFGPEHERWSIAAQYPRPEFITEFQEVSSLDYRPPTSAQ